MIINQLCIKSFHSKLSQLLFSQTLLKNLFQIYLKKKITKLATFGKKVFFGTGLGQKINFTVAEKEC